MLPPSGSGTLETLPSEDECTCWEQDRLVFFLRLFSSR